MHFELHGRCTSICVFGVASCDFLLFLIENASQITICACGTSWHAALVGEYLIETLANTRVKVQYASEFRYRQAHNDALP
jgi:glucosamine 6-phosphate synthetase-like amidotransferase/phosphosugar isomerase protein